MVPPRGGGLHIVRPSRRGILRPDLRVVFEVGPPYAFVPDSVAVALKPDLAGI